MRYRVEHVYCAAPDGACNYSGRTLMKMISITLNGERRDIPDGSTVTGILALAGAGQQPVAVVVNEQIVRPADRETSLLKENDQVDVLVFAGGG